MARKKTFNIMRGAEAFTGPTQCLNEIIQAWSEYKKIAEVEQTKRRAIKAQEKTVFEEIKLKRDFLIGYLEQSFDERAQNFQILFQLADKAMNAGDNKQLGLTLDKITELAKSSPFKELADLSKVQAALNDPNHIWEI